MNKWMIWGKKKTIFGNTPYVSNLGTFQKHEKMTKTEAHGQKLPMDIFEFFLPPRIIGIPMAGCQGGFGSNPCIASTW